MSGKESLSPPELHVVFATSKPIGKWVDSLSRKFRERLQAYGCKTIQVINPATLIPGDKRPWEEPRVLRAHLAAGAKAARAKRVFQHSSVFLGKEKHYVLFVATDVVTSLLKMDGKSKVVTVHQPERKQKGKSGKALEHSKRQAKERAIELFTHETQVFWDLCIYCLLIEVTNDGRVKTIGRWYDALTCTTIIKAQNSYDVGQHILDTSGSGVELVELAMHAGSKVSISEREYGVEDRIKEVGEGGEKFRKVRGNKKEKSRRAPKQEVPISHSKLHEAIVQKTVKPKALFVHIDEAKKRIERQKR